MSLKRALAWDVFIVCENKITQNKWHMLKAKNEREREKKREIERESHAGRDPKKN